MNYEVMTLWKKFSLKETEGSFMGAHLRVSTPWNIWRTSANIIFFS